MQLQLPTRRTPSIRALTRAALRPSGRGAAAAAAKAAAKGDARRGALLRGGWGDDETDSGPLNPDYDHDLYADLSARTRR